MPIEQNVKSISDYYKLLWLVIIIVVVIDFKVTNNNLFTPF